MIRGLSKHSEYQTKGWHVRRDLVDARVLITGASSGIGYHLAELAARAGCRLLLTARREERLQQLAAQLAADPAIRHPVAWLAGDITCEQTRRRLRQAIQGQLQGLDILVNNAGVGAIGRFADSEPDRLRRIMEVNFFAAAELIRETLPILKQGRRPLIANVSSVLGHRAVPGKSEYCASKFALHGFSDALRAELAGEGIDVLLVSPSTTQSEFFDRLLAGADQPAAAPPAADPTTGAAGKGQPQRSPRRGAAAPWVARRTLAAIRRGNHEVILTGGGKALVWLDRLCPRLADWLVARFG